MKRCLLGVGVAVALLAGCAIDQKYTLPLVKKVDAPSSGAPPDPYSSDPGAPAVGL